MSGTQPALTHSERRRVRARLDAEGLTRKALAELLDVAPSVITKELNNQPNSAPARQKIRGWLRTAPKTPAPPPVPPGRRVLPIHLITAVRQHMQACRVSQQGLATRLGTSQTNISLALNGRPAPPQVLEGLQSFLATESPPDIVHSILLKRAALLKEWAALERDLARALLNPHDGDGLLTALIEQESNRRRADSEEVPATEARVAGAVRYTRDQKLEAVALARSTTVAGAARELGIARSTLRKWVALAEGGP